MKNILIYTVTAGNGHNTIASTIKKSLEVEYKNKVNVIIIDFFNNYKTPIRAFIYDKGYRFIVKYFCGFYNLCFKAKLKNNPTNKNSLDIKFSLIGKYSKILKTIKEFKPDYIICTHFLPAIALTNLKKINKIDIPFGSIVTDFVVCPFTEQLTKVNDIFLPSSDLVKNAISIGFNINQIKVFGFPSKLVKNQYIKEYKNDNFRLNIMIMAGSGGFKYLNRNIKNLIKEDLKIDLILVSGKNNKNFLKNNRLIKNKIFNNMTVKLYNEVDFLSNNEHANLFKNCDIVVTKCGANSLVEALNNSKVIITSKFLAQQEKENYKYFLDKIPLFFISKKNTLTDIIKQNRFDKSFFNEYKNKINALMLNDVNKKYAEYIFNSY